MSIEQTFQYTRVDALPPGAQPRFLPDTVSKVDSTGRVRFPVWRRMEQRSSRCRAKGDTTSARWLADSLARDGRLAVIATEGIRVRVLLPCDRDELVTSPELPASIYGSDEELFPNTDFRALRREVEGSLGMSDQAEWNPQAPKLFYGIDRKMLRYNRIEGLSAGIMGERTLGKGYTGGALARIGVADREPLGEVFMGRGNVATEVQASAYRRLAAVNDWGDPLGVGASIAAVVFGRDDGFYFRTVGAEVTGTQRSASDRLLLSWRLF